MLWNKQVVNASSLPVVIVISALIMMLILSAFSLRMLDYQNHEAYMALKQRRLDIHSAAALYMCDSTIMGESDSARISLYGEDEDSISVKKQCWGLYEIVSVRHDTNDPDEKMYMMGRCLESSHRAALWVSDRNAPLSLAGSSSVLGLTYAPFNGIKYPEIEGCPFQGSRISPEVTKNSRRYLPELDTKSLTHLNSLKSLRKRRFDYSRLSEGRQYHSFKDSTIFTYCKNSDETEFHLKGKIVLYGDRLIISGKSEMQNIIIFARSVLIEEGFRGCAQIFCEDSIFIGRNVKLSYPSGLLVDASLSNTVCITVGENSQVSGYVGIINGDKNSRTQEPPCFKLHKHSLVRGLVYVDGTCELAGAIKGAAYIKDCSYRGKNSSYVGTLYNASIAREDSLAFPILLDGPYQRKIVKNMY